MHHARPRPASRFRACLAALALLALPAAAAAQDRAGEFDHYILALTWMPAYCATDGAGRDDPRCAAGRREGWRVHGLWPQHRGGRWPEHCATQHRAPSRAETAAQTEIFGTSGAAWHQWNKHGRCTGLSAAGYYALTRLALDRLALPPVFARIEQELAIDPAVIEAAFTEANPRLTPDTMVTTCRRDLLVELRICLTRELEPRPCDSEVRACRLSRTRLLPLE